MGKKKEIDRYENANVKIEDIIHGNKISYSCFIEGRRVPIFSYATKVKLK